MSINNNSKIVTDGLSFYYDANNVKSYVGPPLQNILTQITPTGIGVGTGYVATTGSETVNIPTLGDTFVNFVTIQNNYTAFAPNSSNCCPNLYYYGTGTLLPSTLYTYAIVYKCESGYTHPNFMYQYDYNGGTYVTEFGLHTTGQRTHLGGGWYWAWATFTTQASVNTLQGSGLWYYQYSSGVDKVTVAKAMMVQGNYTTLHPRYWPALNTTRSNTQAIIDLTGNNTLTANSLTYASDGTFSFNGSSSIITIPNNTIMDTQTPTVEVWVKTNATTQNGFWFEKGSVNTQYALFQEGSSIQWRLGSLGDLSTTTASYINTANWYQVVGTYTSGDRRLYINGVQVNSNATTGVLSTNSSGASIGAYGGETGSHNYYYNGNIASVKVYNKALSAAEVKQNFNALRGRYGI